MASATDPAASASSGPVLAGRYLLGPVLGRGGAADVYRADDQLLSRPVAVKVLRESAEDPSSRDRFIHEARLLAQLSHVAVVTVLDAGFTDERPYLVLELVTGSTLEQVGAGVPLPLDRVGRIGAQVADALEHAHQAGVVHRDIKPSNVLVGDDDRVKVADFGIARLIGDTVRHTQTGHAIGTAAYLSPEQVTGGDLSGAVDVYSLGLVLIEALTGERAYPGPPTEAALARLHRSPVVPRHVPEAWQRLLSAMTATDPAERPDAAGVAAVLRGRTLPAPPAPAPPPDAAGSTRLLTEVVPTAVPPPPRTPPPSTPPPSTPPPSAPPPTGPPPSSPPPAAPPAIDRWGDQLSGAAARGVAAVRGSSSTARGIAAAVAALLVLLLVAALASGGGTTEDRPVPDGTPDQLQGPLGDLHDAVEGDR